MYLQEIPESGKYSYYGCFCFPNGKFNMFSGRGQPVDLIDSSCKSYHQCNRCIDIDFGENICSKTKGYDYEAIVDETTGHKRILCSKYKNLRL